MKRTIFITGTDTGVGKTVLTALLAAFLHQRGDCVAALKPVCSGGRGDARALRSALDGALTLDQINPWHFRAPIAPMLAAQREKKVVKLTQILAHVRAAQKDFDTVLIEGAGGLLSPMGADFNSRDLIAALGATPVIVAPNRLGAVNHVLLTLEALPKRTRARASVVLMTPSRADSATASNADLLEKMGVKTIYRLPWFSATVSPTTHLKEPRTRRVIATLANGQGKPDQKPGARLG